MRSDAAETRKTFEQTMYGPLPPRPGSTTVGIGFHDPAAFGGLGTLTELEIRTKDPDATFRLLVAAPLGEPAVTFLGLNFRGNHALSADERIVAHQRWVFDDTVTERGGESATFDLAANVGAGYAVATLFAGDVVPDRPDLAEPVLAGFATGGERPGALMVWAWSLSRALDVLAAPGTPFATDPGAIVAVGHSRMGKAALLASGWDDRFAAAIASQSGSAGAAPNATAPERAVPGPDGRPEAETIAAITSRFPHWFGPGLATSVAQGQPLPIEQDQLLALTLPRPLLLWNGADDLWADPLGTFDLVRHLTEAPDLPYPDVDQILSGPPPHDPLSYGLRAGGHGVTVEDWNRWRGWAGSALAAGTRP